MHSTMKVNDQSQNGDDPTLNVPRRIKNLVQHKKSQILKSSLSYRNRLTNYLLLKWKDNESITTVTEVDNEVTDNNCDALDISVTLVKQVARSESFKQKDGVLEMIEDKSETKQKVNRGLKSTKKGNKQNNVSSETVFLAYVILQGQEI